MRQYEAMFILKSDLQEDAFNKAAAELLDIIKKNKGEINSSQKWADNKQLAYEIRVPATGGYRKHKTGTYYLVTFSAPGDAIDKLKQAFKLDENVIRVLITVKK